MRSPETISLQDRGFDIEARRASGARLPSAVRFRETRGRGLLVKAWINGAGPYTFAVDTGAGATILSRRVANEARVAIGNGPAIEIGGLSGSSRPTGREAQVRSLAIGDRSNLLPSKGLAIVADGLPHDIDGILDPTEAFWPLGYVIDLPNNLLSAFDPRTTPLRLEDVPPGGAVVPWLSEAGGRRPFVMLRSGQRALLDTGSGFGLALSAGTARAIGIAVDEGRDRRGAQDLAGGKIGARRIRPATVHVGSLTLRGVPTDLLSGVDAGAPVLLGRDALRPFHLTFDPTHRLIRISPR